jgi:hypothetical protein
VAFCLLSLAVGLGACLVAGRLYRAALVHGLAGLGGLAALCVALARGALRGAVALDTAVLLAAAALGGVVLYALGRARRPRPGLVVLLHAMAGGLAYLLLAGVALRR